MSYKVGIYGPLTSEALAVYMQLGIDAVFLTESSDVEVRNYKYGLGKNIWCVAIVQEA